MSIIASRCLYCARAIIPRRTVCPYCGPSSTKMKDIILKNQGEVMTYTVSHMPPEGFQPPLYLALVKLEHDAMILCLAESPEVGKVEIGDSVSVSVGADGRFFYRLS